MSKVSTNHATFVIERTYEASPARVFRAWSGPKSKGRWFVGPDDWSASGYELDFRIGGHEHLSGGPPGGPVHTYDAIYRDIVPNERVIYAYDMHLGDRRISCSLATVELKPAGKGTKLIFTEQAAYLDGFDVPDAREKGTKDLLDNLDRALREEAAAV